MRKREEIEILASKNSSWGSFDLRSKEEQETRDLCILEVLLDIRELLQKANDKTDVKNLLG